MKKLFILIVCISCFGLSGCGNKEPIRPENPKQKPDSPPVQMDNSIDTEKEAK